MVQASRKIEEQKYTYLWQGRIA